MKVTSLTNIELRHNSVGCQILMTSHKIIASQKRTDLLLVFHSLMSFKIRNAWGCLILPLPFLSYLASIDVVSLFPTCTFTMPVLIEGYELQFSRWEMSSAAMIRV